MSKGIGAPSFFSRGLIALILTAVAFRLVHLWQQASSLPFLSHPILDAALYHEWAASLAGGLSPFDGPFYHAPGYSLVLSSVYGVFGASPLAAVWFHTLLGLGTIALTALLGRRLLGPREGIIAGAILVFFAPFYFFEAKLLAATLSVFLSVLSVYLTTVALDVGADRRKKKTFLMLAFAGGSAGMLSVVRANLILLPVIMLVVLLVRAVRSGPRTNVSPWIPVIYAVAVMLAILPTLSFNLARGAAAPVATNGGFNFYAGNLRGASGTYTDFEGVSGAIRTQETEADSLVYRDLGRVLPPGEESRYWFRRGVGEILADPADWIGLVGKKAWLLVNRQEETVNGSLAVETSRIWILRLAFFPFNVLCGLGLVGLVLARGWFGIRPGARGSLTPALALLIAILISGLAFFVMTRLRLPAVPILAVFAAHALVRARDAWPSARRVVFAGAGLVALFSAITWVSPLGAARNPFWESHLFLEAAQSLEAEGDLKGAREAYRSARELNPGSLDAMGREAEVAMQEGDFVRAIEVLEGAMYVYPDEFSVQSNLGILYFAVGRMNESLRAMERATELDPDAGAPYLYRGRILKAQGDERARELFEAALARDSRLHSAYLDLIELSLDAGDLPGARAWMEKAGERGVAIPDSLRSRLP